MSDKTLSILIVDDSETIRTLLSTYLEPYAEVEYAEDGKEGLEKYLQKIALKQTYDLLFLDINMPKMNGGEVLKEIRNHEINNKLPDTLHTKVCVVTCNTDSLVDAMDSDLEGYMVKPFFPEDVIKQLQQHKLISL